MDGYYTTSTKPLGIVSIYSLSCTLFGTVDGLSVSFVVVLIKCWHTNDALFISN